MYLFSYFALISAVTAHTFLHNIITDGKEQPAKECIRQLSGSKTDMVIDLKSDDMRCRKASMDVSTTKTCPVQAGSEFSIVWHHYDNTTSDNVISPSHRGPCLVYLGQQQDNPDDIKWFKIYEQGFNKDTDLWCTDVVRNAHGRLSFTLPMDIVDGEYLLRTEIIALHKAKNSGGAQFFPNCVQLSITGSNKKFRCPRPKYVSIPGVYSSTDPGILYNVYNDKGANYIIPGPPVYPPTSAKPSKQLFVE